MKSKYEKPNAEIILFKVDNRLMNDDDDIIDGEIGASGEFDF